MRSVLKQAFERLLLQSGPAALSRQRWRRGAVILAYHNILPAGVARGGADPSLHLPRERFAAQLDETMRRCEVVSLADLLAGCPAANRPVAAITFDDCYSGALSAGLEELASRGLPATYFVTPGCIDGHAFWWDAFVERDGAPIRPVTREHLLEELGGQTEPVRRWGATNLREVEVPEVARAASLATLRAAGAIRGISFGSHTWTHPNLARLEPAALERELEEPLSWIAATIAPPVRALAFPYGRFSEPVVEALPGAGYQVGLAITGGWFRREAARGPVLPRLNVPSGLSDTGFALRLAGVLQ